MAEINLSNLLKPLEYVLVLAQKDYRATTCFLLGVCVGALGLTGVAVALGCLWLGVSFAGGSNASRHTDSDTQK